MSRFTPSLIILIGLSFSSAPWTHGEAAKVENIVLILSDDHRYDLMGFMEEAHLNDAFVTTSLCSPNRASILTGQYIHHHRVVDNQRAVPEGTVFFPGYLQAAGVQAAFVGKWHMGHDDESPTDEFDHWVSFLSQGKYFDPTLNINGTHRDFEAYNADVLTGQALCSDI